MREELEHRPLLVAALALAIGLGGANHWPLLAFWALLLAAMRPAGLRLTAAVVGCAGLILAPEIPREGLQENVFVRGEAHVLTMPWERPDDRSANIQIGNIRLFATFPGANGLGMGDTLQVEGVAQPLTEASDARALSDGVIGRIRLEPEQVRIVSKGPWLYQIGATWRQGLLDLTHQSLRPDDEGFVDGLCFGATGFIDDDRMAALKRTGTAHLVVASGLHVLVLAAALLAFFGLMPIPRGATVFLMAIVLVIYACAAGLNPAVVRATIMAIAGSFAYLFRRESDPLSSLSLAAMVVLLWHPESLYQRGFHLSILVVVALVLFARRRSEWSPEAALRTSVESVGVASLASAPIMALEFGFVPIISVILNLFMIVLLAPIIVLAMLSWAMASIWHEEAVMLMRGAGTLANGLGWMLDLGAAQKWASIAVPAFSPYWLILLYGIPLLLWRKHLRPA